MNILNLGSDRNEIDIKCNYRINTIFFYLIIISIRSKRLVCLLKINLRPIKNVQVVTKFYPFKNNEDSYSIKIFPILPKK